MTSLVSTLGVMLASINRLSSSQSTLANLSEQLSSGVKSQDLADYSAQDAKVMLNLNAAITKRTGYLNVIETLATRVNVYDEALSGIEGSISDAISLTATAASYNPDTNDTTAEQIKGYLSQIGYYLNTESGDRYLFSGTRYTTAPVSDLLSLLSTDPTTESIITDESAFPQYDVQYGTAAPTAPAYTEDSAIIDTESTVTYGISSDDPAFQKLILGLRYAYEATQDTANYESLMQTAQQYMMDGSSDVQVLHTRLSARQVQFDAVKTRLENAVTDASNQIDDIKSVDTNEVSVKLTTMQTTLEAAYSATAILEQLTILNYL